MARTPKTHPAAPPHEHTTHPGLYETCTHDGCASYRAATGILRETEPLDRAEQAAADAIRDAKWILWHAEDRDLAVALVLSRAGLLRDRVQEDKDSHGRTKDIEARNLRRRADQLAIAALSGLAEEAAGFLEGGADPKEVAAKLREISANILARRERRAASVGLDDATV